MTTPLLKVENLRIALESGGTTFDATESVSFEIGRGEAFGLVGESGCGKSITALAVMGLLRRPLSLAGGRIVLDGEEIQDVPAAEMRRLRGKRIAMIFQEPMTSLNPVLTIGRQIGELIAVAGLEQPHQVVHRLLVAIEELLQGGEQVLLCIKPGVFEGVQLIEQVAVVLLGHRLGLFGPGLHRCKEGIGAGLGGEVVRLAGGSVYPRLRGDRRSALVAVVAVGLVIVCFDGR